MLKKFLLILGMLSIFLSCVREVKETKVEKALTFPKFVMTDDSTDVTVYVDTSYIVGTIKPHAIRGVNLNNSMQVAKVVKWALDLKIPTVTYPAGNIGDTQDCNREMDFNFYSLQLSMVENPFTFVQTRVFGGTPEGTVQSVKNAEKAGFKVDIWSIGNEPDLYHRAHAPEWTPQYYNKVFREQVSAMREYKSDIKVAGPLVSQPNDNWIRTFIEENGDIVDVLAWHWYPTSGDADDEVALATAPDITNQIRRYRGWLKDPKINKKGYNRDIKLALTEYAIHWNTPNKRHLADMVGAMWLAEVVGYLALEGIDYSHYFCFGEYGGHSLFEPGNYKPRPSYWVFNFYANRFATNLVACISTDKKLKVFSSRNTKNYIIAVNQSKEKIKNLKISLLNNEEKVSKVILTSLTADLKGAIVKSITNEVSLENIKVSLEPYSVNAIELE